MNLLAPDVGMTLPELAAVRRALACERNPNHLLGFAAALAPEHCVSASLLHARAELLEQRRCVDPRCLQAALAAVGAIAMTPMAASAQHTLLLQHRAAVDRYASLLRGDPRVLYAAVRSAAGDLVVDDSATLDELPSCVRDLSRSLVERVEVSGVPVVRVLHPTSVRVALPPSGATVADQLERRGRWVRQYIQEARIAAGG